MGEQWYSNKELFELINHVQKDFTKLRAEMSETRRIIMKYNGLYQKIEKINSELKEMKAKQEGKNNFEKSIQDWGGWIFGLITLVILLINQFI